MTVQACVWIRNACQDISLNFFLNHTPLDPRLKTINSEFLWRCLLDRRIEFKKECMTRIQYPRIQDTYSGLRGIPIFSSTPVQWYVSLLQPSDRSAILNILNYRIIVLWRGIYSLQIAICKKPGLFRVKQKRRKSQNFWEKHFTAGDKCMRKKYDEVYDNEMWKLYENKLVVRVEFPFKTVVWNGKRNDVYSLSQER